VAKVDDDSVDLGAGERGELTLVGLGVGGGFLEVTDHTMFSSVSQVGNRPGRVVRQSWMPCSGS
jgi:hypothetical protein